MPAGFTIGKTTALVNALAKLHNFCIDEKVLDDDVDNANNHQDHTPAVSAILATQRLITLRASHTRKHGIGIPVPVPLLHGGEHHDDIVRPKNPAAGANEEAAQLPRDRMLTWVIQSGKTRPNVGYEGEVVLTL